MKIIKKEDLKNEYFKELLNQESILSFFSLNLESKSKEEERKIKSRFFLSDDEYYPLKTIMDNQKTKETLKDIASVSNMIKIMNNFEKDFEYVFNKNSIGSNGGRSSDYMLELKNEKNENVHLILSVSDMGVFSGVNKKDFKSLDAFFLSEVKEFFDILYKNPNELRTILMYETVNKSLIEKKDENNFSKLKI